MTNLKKPLKSKYYNLRMHMTKLARETAPVDTGNLKNNGIYSMLTPKGFRIVWDKRYAHYIEYVNEGRYSHNSEKIQRNIGFVDRGIQNSLIPIKQIQNENYYSFKGSGKSNLKYSLPYFMLGKNTEAMNKKFYDSIDLSQERFPDWDYETVLQTDVSEYDEIIDFDI